MLCNLVGGYLNFGDEGCFHVQGWKLYDLTSSKTPIWSFVVVKTSKPVITVCPENLTKHVNTLCGRSAEFLNSGECTRSLYSYRCDLRVKRKCALSGNFCCHDNMEWNPKKNYCFSNKSNPFKAETLLKKKAKRFTWKLPTYLLCLLYFAFWNLYEEKYSCYKWKVGYKPYIVFNNF